MDKQKAPQFPLYYRDFLHAVRHFDKVSAYDYLLLLIEQADSKNGSISEAIFEKMCSTEFIREKFEEDSNGWFNVRMRDILHKREEFSKLQTERINKRWNKSGKQSGTDSGTTFYDSDNDNDNDKGKKEKGLKREKPETAPLIYPFDSELFMNRWQSWKDYKAEQFAFKYKPRGEQAALKSLGELSGTNEKLAISIIEQSMANGWKGLFELDSRNGTSDEHRAELLRKGGDYLKDKYKSKY